METQQIKKKVSSFSIFLSSLGIQEVKSKIALVVLLSLVIIAATLSFFLIAPPNFPLNKIIVVEKGMSLGAVSELLYQENIIRSQTLFEFSAKVIGGKKPIAAESYLFKEPTSVWAVAKRITHGVSGVPALRVTIPEGISNSDISTIFAKLIPGFDRNIFIKKMSDQEGFLFPDTYFFPESVTLDTIEKTMLENFNNKISVFKNDISTSGHSLAEIITMASILEKEASTEEDKKIISGILWKRIEEGMPLQVDATFMYLMGKKSSELTLVDLKIDNPYNTYKNKGLPIGPIGNPGIIAINATLNPVASPYWYYLSDENGVMHYAKTFEEHKANKAKYLK